MIDQEDISSFLEDFQQYFSSPQSAANVLFLMNIIVEHVPEFYHHYSFQFRELYPYNSIFCPRFVRDLRWGASASISDSRRHLGGYYTLDSQLHWNYSENRSEFTSYKEDIVGAARCD